MNKDQRIDESFVLCRLQLELYICLVLIGFKISRDMNRQRVGWGGGWVGWGIYQATLTVSS